MKVERLKSVLLMMRKKPGEKLRFGVRLVPGVMPDALVLVVANVTFSCLQGLNHLARLGNGHDRIRSAVKDPDRRSANLRRHRAIRIGNVLQRSRGLRQL